MSLTYAIADLHGRFDLLTAAFDAIVKHGKLAPHVRDVIFAQPISVFTADNTPAHAAARSFASFSIDSRHSLHRRRSQLTPRQDVTQSPPK